VAGPDDAGAFEAAKRSGPQRRLLSSRGPGFATLPSIRNGRRCSARPWKAHLKDTYPHLLQPQKKKERSRGGGRESAGITQSGTLALHTPVEASEASRGRDLAAPLRTGLIPGGTLHCGPLGACAARSPRHLATPVPAGLIWGGTLNESPIEAGGARVAGCAAGPPAGRCPFWGGCGGGPAAATTRIAATPHPSTSRLPASPSSSRPPSSHPVPSPSSSSSRPPASPRLSAPSSPPVFSADLHRAACFLRTNFGPHPSTVPARVPIIVVVVIVPAPLPAVVSTIFPTRICCGLHQAACHLRTNTGPRRYGGQHSSRRSV